LRFQVAVDTAKGVSFLHCHKPAIIHRDLKSPNVLLDSTRRSKVCDFGLARNQTAVSMTAQVGTFQWMAPEVIGSNHYTEKADVYSFGVIMWELVSRKVPYQGMNAAQVSVAVYTKGLRPDIPESTPRPFADLIQECWHQDPNLRPPFLSILERLKQIRTLMKPYKIFKHDQAQDSSPYPWGTYNSNPSPFPKTPLMKSSRLSSSPLPTQFSSPQQTGRMLSQVTPGKLENKRDKD